MDMTDIRAIALSIVLFLLSIIIVGGLWEYRDDARLIVRSFVRRYVQFQWHGVNQLASTLADDADAADYVTDVTDPRRVPKTWFRRRGTPWNPIGNLLLGTGSQPIRRLLRSWEPSPIVPYLTYWRRSSRASSGPLPSRESANLSLGESRTISLRCAASGARLRPPPRPHPPASSVSMAERRSS